MEGDGRGCGSSSGATGWLHYEALSLAAGTPFFFI